MSLLSARSLRVAVGARVLVEGLELEIGPGDVLAVLGRNGSGKTSLLHTLAGLRSATGGGVLLQRTALAARPRREVARQLGLLLQSHEDAFPLSVLEAVLIGRHPHLGFWQWESAQDRAIAAAALAAVQLEGLEERALDTLSGGERRRVAIAALLAQQPRVYLLDEPFNHLDPQHQIAVLEHFAALARAGCAVVATLHDPNLAARFATRSLLLHGDGRWVEGAVGTVLTAENLSALYHTPIVQLPSPFGPVFTSAATATSSSAASV